MGISFDKAFGIHPDAMRIRSERAEILASNIANADTPGFKAQDMDFATALQNAKMGQSYQLSRTHEKHIKATSSLTDGTQFRNPWQPDTGDGNTVDVQVERNLYVENSIAYQASLRFMTGKIKGLKKALAGQGGA